MGCCCWLSAIARESRCSIVEVDEGTAVDKFAAAATAVDEFPPPSELKGTSLVAAEPIENNGPMTCCCVDGGMMPLAEFCNVNGVGPTVASNAALGGLLLLAVDCSGSSGDGGRSGGFVTAALTVDDGCGVFTDKGAITAAVAAGAVAAVVARGAVVVTVVGGTTAVSEGTNCGLGATSEFEAATCGALRDAPTMYDGTAGVV